MLYFELSLLRTLFNLVVEMITCMLSDSQGGTFELFLFQPNSWYMKRYMAVLLQTKVVN